MFNGRPTKKTETMNNNIEIITADSFTFSNGYSEANGQKMYHEIYGQKKLIVLLHGGCSTIQATFEKAILLFAENKNIYFKNYTYVKYH